MLLYIYMAFTESSPVRYLYRNFSPAAKCYSAGGVLLGVEHSGSGLMWKCWHSLPDPVLNSSLPCVFLQQDMNETQPSVWHDYHSACKESVRSIKCNVVRDASTTTLKGVKGSKGLKLHHFCFQSKAVRLTPLLESEGFNRPSSSAETILLAVVHSECPY